MEGHSVLQVPVPPLEPFVRARTEHDDPAFVHAHVTALGPFVDQLTARCRAEGLDLAWYAPHGSRVVASWPLG